MEHAQYVTQFETAIVLVAADMGITFFPRSFKLRGNPAIHFVDVDCDFYMDMVLAFSRHAISPLLQHFIALCREWEFGA